MGWARRIAALALLLLASLAPAGAQQQQQGARLALVVGNAAYATPGWALKNPVNDATLIADRLRALGFTVDPVMNASKARMEQAMAGFAARLRAAGPEAVGVFYYAGHAAEHDGANVLVPVDVRAGTMDELRYQAPPLNFLLRDMARAGNRVNIVVLDACRDLPLPAGTRSGPAGGLADFSEVPTNILLAYATRAGATAPDNPRETNSVFTRTLAEALRDSASEPVSVLFETVQARVAQATGFSQRPEFRNQLLRAPGFRLAATAPASIDPELERLRRENEALRRLGAGTTPAASAPAVAVQRPDEGVVARAQGQTFRDCAQCPEMTVVPGGAFMLGSPTAPASSIAPEVPQRAVTLRSFAMATYETTFEQWDACVAGGGCGGYRPDDKGWGRGRNPVINVSWADAKAYVTWLNSRVGKTAYRLPSEAEWEYAARGGTTTWYWWGDDFRPTLAVTMGGRTRPVGSFPANPFGLHDVSGNASEWVEDCRATTYQNHDPNGAPWKASGCDYRMIRGGGWERPAEQLRVASRNSNSAPMTARQQDYGFRVARTLD